MQRFCTILAVSITVLSGCALPAQQSDVPSVTAALYDSSGTKIIGKAQLRSSPITGKTRLSLNVALPPGTYGMHLHSVGACTAPDFASAGPHWNPMPKQHGFDNPMGSHGGDLPNLVIGSTGNDGITIDVPAINITASGLMDADGASIIIHAKPDDYKTDPSGASGARLVCGVFAKTP